MRVPASEGNPVTGYVLQKIKDVVFEQYHLYRASARVL
jgi:hypothetical protein